MNVNRDVDIDVDRDWDGNALWGVTAGVAVGTAAVATAAAIGSSYYRLPSGCNNELYAGVTYYRCGGAWYAPRYAGADVTYVVVNPPY